MAGQPNQLTLAEKAGLWLKAQKQQSQQQNRQQHPVEQQQHGQQLDQKPQQQQLPVRGQVNVMTFAEQAELWYKKQSSQQQPQQKHGQQYSQEQQQKQQQQQQKVQKPLQQEQQPLQQKTGQGPLQMSGLSGLGPLQTSGLTEQGPILANKVSQSQHPDAHDQGRLSSQMSPTQAHSKQHSQQYPQQHAGVDKRQPTDSPHDPPQSSLVSDVMSMSPSIPHQQKRVRLNETSSRDYTRNARETSERQDFNDGSHPGTNIKHRTQDLRAKDGTKKGGQVRCWKTKIEQSVSFLHNLRRGQIIEMEVSEMEDLCCLEKIIGKGSYGTVYEAKINNEEIGRYVIKKIEVAEYDELRRKSYEREIYHGRILHPHIIPIIAHAEDISRNTSAVYLMYPYMENGSVRLNIEHENKGKLLCEEDTTNSKIWLRCFYQVSQALDFLHKPGKNNSRGPVFHRDLTSRNILFDEDFNVKICDFGIAVEAKYHANDATATSFHRSMGYHPCNMNPSKYRAYDDVYSFCVVVLEILTGEVVKKEEHFKKYKMEEVLLHAINTRAEKIKVAKWPDESSREIRDHLAKKAWEVITSDGKGGKTEVTVADFFKDVRLETRRCYQQPKNSKRCVLCYINPTAKHLPLKGEDCKHHSPPCATHCVHCLSDHNNELVCPMHGPSRPPFGDHVYTVFVAGNHVKHFQGKMNMTGKNVASLADIAGIFISDANKVANILKFPLVLGVRNEHLEVVTPKDPGKEGQMVDSIKEAFKKIDSSIRDALTDNGKNPDTDRLENSLFIFYFTGHGCKQNGLYLGSERETINASTDWLKEMLHHTLRVDQVLVILDCCHAAKQNFARKKRESEIGILQLSSCDKNEKSLCNEQDLKGSFFTHFLCQALQGDNFVETEGHFTKLCKYCENEKNKKKSSRSHCEEFHLSCSDRQSVTLSSVKDYIRGHYKLLGFRVKIKENATDVEEIHLGYYKPEMSNISICLKESQNGAVYSISSHPESMSSLKMYMVKYIEEKKVQCEIQDMLEFYKKLCLTSAVEKTSALIAIHPVAGKETKELISLDDIWKIRPCGRTLEAKIRNNMKGLKLKSNVKLYNLKRVMTSSLQEDYKDDGLKISKEDIHVQVNLIEEVIKKLIHLQSSESAGLFSQEFKELLENLQETLQEAFDNKKGTVLKFQLYEEFSVLEITK